MMTPKFVMIENPQQGIAFIKLNRAEKRNAMHGPMVTELRAVLKQLAADENVRVVLLGGMGDHFCAGGDIEWMSEVALSNDNAADALQLAHLMFDLYVFPKPTIVLAHGATLGGGIGLLSACDIALASEDASFGFAEVKVGITPSTISPYVIRAIG